MYIYLCKFFCVLMRAWSPSHDKVPELGEKSFRQRLGEHVTQFVFCAHGPHSDLWVIPFGVRMEVVIVIIDVFRLGPYVWQLHKLDCSPVVFECCAMHSSRCELFIDPSGDDHLQQLHDRYLISQCQ